MAIRIIRLSDDEILRKRSKKVKEITPNIITLLDDMLETMNEESGLGLAAPQVGILKRIVIINIGDGLLELINPEIIEYSGENLDEEGCLSIPGEKGYVIRPKYVKIEAFDRHNKKIIVEGEDLMARAICHELDHLDGILYIDKLEEVEEEEN